jgi:PAS domain S-box-containing protein
VRKKAERERGEAESRFRDLIESVPLVTYMDRVDEHATNVYTSPQAVAMLGWPLDDWEADPRFFETILHPDDYERVMGQVHEANATREEFDSEYRLRHQDGHYVWVRDRSAILDDPTEPFARGFLLDITQEKELEEQLLQAQKMDALGQFAGGIAHDFNNLLTGIAGYAELGSPGAAADLTRCLDGIKTAAAEAASLTSSLLAFSRRNVPERKPVDGLRRRERPGRQAVDRRGPRRRHDRPARTSRRGCALAAVEEAEGTAEAVSGTERVLVVDDREVVRNLVGDVLVASASTSSPSRAGGRRSACSPRARRSISC